MATPPTVIHPLTLPSLLHHVLTTQSNTTSTTLIICSTRDAFLQNLVGTPEIQDGQDQTREKLLHLAAPTLHNLFTARHIKVTFCASVQALLAYLTSFRPSATREETCFSKQRESNQRIILVNPLSLHAATTSFSAQGLSRTFAAAVDTSLRIHAQLVVAECRGGWLQPTAEDENENEHEHEEDGENGAKYPHVSSEDPWEQDASILNVSAKKFGLGASDRVWAGRSVKVKRVAARWFRFLKLDDLEP